MTPAPRTHTGARSSGSRICTCASAASRHPRGFRGASAERYATTQERSNALPRNTRLLLERLESRYGIAVWRPTGQPIETLVACVLSQHTSDNNSARAYRNLRDRYGTWEAVVAAPATAVADAIRCGGLADTKAERIQACLRSIREREGAFDLCRLSLLPLDRARRYLTDLPGIGPKTAAIVLCFALGRPALPVDTHVFRTSWRLGLIDRKQAVAAAHSSLQAMVDDELVYRFHVAMLTLGKDVCRARRPACCRCALVDHCPSAEEFVVGEGRDQ